MDSSNVQEPEKAEGLHRTGSAGGCTSASARAQPLLHRLAWHGRLASRGPALALQPATEDPSAVTNTVNFPQDEIHWPTPAQHSSMPEGTSQILLDAP